MSNLTAEIIKKGMEYNKEEIKRFYEDEFKEIFREEGKEEGREEGREEGKKKTLITSIKNLMKNLGITAEKAMDTLEIKKEDRSVYLKALQK